jgi:hypothetical protein
MVELMKDKFDRLRSQIATSNHGSTGYVPMVFTEQEFAMFSKSTDKIVLLFFCSGGKTVKR